MVNAYPPPTPYGETIPPSAPYGKSIPPRAAAQPERVKVEDLLATVDYWLERAADGARLKLDGLRAVSEQQGAFFRRQVHEHCKALVPPIMTETEGKTVDPGARSPTGGYVVVINSPRVLL